MTPAKIWTIIRWPIALVALLAIAAYAYPRFIATLPTVIEFDDSNSIFSSASESETPEPVVIAPTAEPTLQPGTGAVVDGTAGAIADFFVNDTAADIDNSVLVLTDDPADAIVLAFALPPGDPACMASMALSLHADEVLSTTEVGVYPSSLSTAVEIVDNEQVDEDLRASQTPMGTALVTERGRVDIDVLTGYRSYFDLGLPPGSPFVVTVQPSLPVDSQGGVRFASTDQANDDVPLLTWVGDPTCTGT